MEMEREGDNEPVNLKRVQNEAEMNNQGWKWGKREGIKRNLRDLPRQSYAECEDDCDELDKSKKPKHGINCLLAALNQNVSRPLRKTDLHPISGQSLGSCVGEQGPPRRDMKPPMSELDVSDGTVPDNTGPPKTQVRTERLNGKMHSRNRRHSVNKDNTGQINVSATNGNVDGIQGGEKIRGENCNIQSSRIKQRRNSYKPGYMMKAMLFILLILGCAGGRAADNWKENQAYTKHTFKASDGKIQGYDPPHLNVGIFGHNPKRGFISDQVWNCSYPSRSHQQAHYRLGTAQGQARTHTVDQNATFARCCGERLRVVWKISASEENEDYSINPPPSHL